MRRHQRQRPDANGDGEVSARQAAHPRARHTAALLNGSSSWHCSTERAGPGSASAVGAATPQGARALRPRSDALTRRQWEVAALVAQGLSNKEIAAQLVLSPGTVANHVEAILRRLKLHNRAQLAAWYVEVSHAQRAGAGETAHTASALNGRSPG